jgi:hypothetical protein
VGNIRRDANPRLARRLVAGRVVGVLDQVDTRDPRRLFARLGRDRIVVAVSKGALGFTDCVEALLLRVAPAAVTLCTWSASPRDCERLARLATVGQITGLRLYIDASFQTLQPAYWAAIRAKFGPAAVVPIVSHAKIAVLTGDRRAIVLLSSANMHRNSRLEFFTAIWDRDLAEGIVSLLAEWYPADVEAAWAAGEPGARRTLEAWRAGEGRSRSRWGPLPAPEEGDPRLAPVDLGDAEFFDGADLGVDLRRVGVSYLK